MAHPRHEQVRQRYGRRCGYCGVSEVHAGGELTVDHFHPLSAGGDESDDNLVYCCSRCNLYKGMFYPTAEELAQGQRILHPLREVLDQHIRCDDQTGLLEPLTPSGSFHIMVLHLNRPELAAHRRQQRYMMMFEATRSLLEAELQQLRSLVSILREDNQRLRRLLGLESK